jgi:hypothetical protein
VRLRWQDPAEPNAIMGPGWRRWTDCPPLRRYTHAKGVPGLMVQGWSWSSLDYAMFHLFATKLADEMPVGIVVNDSGFEALGDWDSFDGTPKFEFPAPAPAQASQPGLQQSDPYGFDPGMFRTFHMGDMAFKSMTMTDEDYRDRARFRAKINAFQRATGGDLLPEDHR